MKILIVEDNADSRIILQKNLEGAGHTVEAAVNGEDALGRARQSPPELIISDILMPVMDGFKLCYEVKNDKNLARIPFVFYTATYVDLEDERLAMGLGASRYIVKPVEPGVFLALINEVIEEAKKNELVVFDETIADPLNLFRMYDKSLSRKLQEKVKELQLFRTMIDHSNDAIFVIEPATARFVDINQRASGQLGYSRDELLKKTVMDIDPHFTSLEAWRKHVSELERNHSTILESLHRKKDGTTFPVEISVVYVTEHGRHHIIAVARDITERKRAENEAEKARKEWEKTFDAVGDIVLLLDTELRVIRANRAACETFQVPFCDLLGKHCYELFRGIDRACPNCPLPRQTDKTMTAYTAEVEHPDMGKTFWLSAAPIFDDQEKFSGLAYFARDITEQKKVEAQYRQSQKLEAIGTLAGGVAHDFNNVLTTILGYLDLTFMRIDQSNPIWKDLKEIEGASQRAARIVRQLLLFSRKQPMEKSVISLTDSINGIIKMLTRFIGEDIEIKTETASDTWPVEGDMGNIDQVLLNLAVNARDAMPRGGTLLFSTRNMEIGEDFCSLHVEAVPGKYVELTVSDTGVGMNREVMQHVFEPFFTTKEFEKGTGLGLAVIYGIVKDHKGWINLYSEPGKGTVFKIYLPAATHVAGIKQTQAEDSIKALQGNGEKILLVEDDMAIRELGLTILKKNGYQVIGAENAEKALELFAREGDIKILVTDVVLPGRSGLELVDELTKQAPTIKVVVCSGYPDQKSQWASIKQQNIPFVAKPYTIKDILRAVKEARERE